MNGPRWRPDPDQPGFLNLGCGEFRAPDPWWNIDLEVRNENALPDELVTRDKSLVDLFGLNSCQRIYMGHLLEHVPWNMLMEFLDDVKDALVPGGYIAIVGPDVLRMIQGWHVGKEPWDIVLSGLEDDLAQFDLTSGGYDGARHQWNAYEARVVRVLEAASFVEVRAIEPPFQEIVNSQWPIVGCADWQCAVTARTAY